MSVAFGIVCGGLGYAGAAVLCGLLLPLLWPGKDRTKADAILTAAYRAGLGAAAVGVVVLLLQSLA